MLRANRKGPSEDAGLDMAEHGMYGYPEQFIPTTTQEVPAS